MMTFAIASASAPSVRGSIGSHASDFSAVSVYCGSMVTSVASFSSMAFRMPFASNCPANASSGLRPHMMRYSEFW
jgi:hypothetical protein